MSNISAKAILNQKAQPNTLTIIGNLSTPYGQGSIRLEKVDSPSIDPATLLLKMVVTDDPGSVKKTARPFNFTLPIGTKTYSRVEIALDEHDRITTDIIRW